MDKNSFFWKIVDGKVPVPPCAKTLGLEFVEIDGERGTIETRFEAVNSFLNPVGHVQGGFLAAMLDDTMGTALASTLKDEELLSTDIDTLMRRLFWEETIRVFEPGHPEFQCSCNREKVGNMLKMLGKEEIESALLDLGQLSINCDFCGQYYEFDAVDCAQLFATESQADAVQQAGNVRH